MNKNHPSLTHTLVGRLNFSQKKTHKQSKVSGAEEYVSPPTLHDVLVCKMRLSVCVIL